MKKSFTKEENLEKFREWKETGNPSIRQELIIYNMPLAEKLAVSMAKKYKIDVQESIQYAYEALIHAVDTFDIQKGKAFSSYAVICIFYYLNVCFSEIFGLPTNYYDLIRDIFNHDESYEEIVDFLVEKNVFSLKSRQQNLDRIHLAHPQLVDYMDYDDNLIASNIDLSTIVEHQNLSEFIGSLLNTLSFHEQQVLILRYGLNDGIYKSYDKVAKIMQLSLTGVCKIEKRALRKLRVPFRWKKIKNYSDQEFLFNMKENYLETIHHDFHDICLDEDYYMFYDSKSMDDELENSKEYRR